MAFLDALGNAFSAENINRAMGDPRFQLGVGLLGRSNMRPFQALGYTMGDMAASQQMARQQQLQDMQMQMQQAQMAARMRQAEQEQQQREAQAQWAQQMGFKPGTPDLYIQQAIKAMFAKPNLELKQIVGPDGRPMWVTEEQALGKPAWTQPVAQVTVGGQFRDLPEQIELDIVKEDAAYYRQQAEGADKAIETSRKGLNLMKQGLTGRWQPVVGAAAAWAGTSPEAAATYDLWRDFATEQALGTLQQFKGPTTDFEYNVARSLAAQQGKTDFANFVALKAAERGARRQRAKRSAYTEWARRHRDTDPDFEEWFETKKNPYPQWDIEQFREEYSRFGGERGRAQQRERKWESDYLR